MVRLNGGTVKKINNCHEYNNEIINYCSNISTINRSGSHDKIYL